MDTSSFNNIIKSLKPCPWTKWEKHADTHLNGNHILLVEYVRYKMIFEIFSNILVTKRI